MIMHGLKASNETAVTARGMPLVATLRFAFAPALQDTLQ
jgi:hypothetical protein